MLIKFITFFVVFFCSFDLFAQNPELIKELEKKLSTEKDTSLIKVLDDLCWNYLFEDPQKSYRYGKQALQLVKNLPNAQQLHSNVLNDLGTYYLITGIYDSALYCFDESFKLKKIVGDERGIIGLNSKKSMVYTYRGQYDKAISEMKDVPGYFERMGDSLNLANALNNIAELHYNLKNSDSALKLHLRNLTLRKGIKDTVGLAATYHGIGSILSDMGDIKGFIHYYDSALYYAEKAKRNDILATLYHNRAVILSGQGNYSEAEKLLQSAIKLNEQMLDLRSICSSLNVLAEIHIRRKEYHKSLELLKRSLYYGKQLGSFDLLKLSYSHIAANYSHLGRADSTFFYASLASQMKDSIVKNESIKALHEFQVKYETAKKEAQNKNLLKENELKNLQLQNEKLQKRNLYLAFGGALILMFTLAFLFLNRAKLKRKTESEELKAREQQIRFKAILDAQEKERSRIAKELHDGVGQMLAGLKLKLDAEGNTEVDSLSLLDNACNELRTISHQMMPAALLKSGLPAALNQMFNQLNKIGSIKFDFEHFSLPVKISEDISVHLYRISQELVTNILKHSAAENAFFILYSNENSLFLVAEDNGKGICLSETKGIGVSNIFSRAESLGGNVKIETPEKGGTIFKINIPL